MKRQEKIKNTIIANLTYYRLKTDLAAVDAELAENLPLASTSDLGFLRNLISKAQTMLTNELRKKTTDELKKDKAAAEYEIARFSEKHNVKKLKLSDNPATLKKLINKKLFKNDTYGLNKIQFALSLVLDDSYTYQRPSQSLLAVSDILFDDSLYIQNLYDTLCKNFKYLHNDVIPSIDELLSLLPTLGNNSLQSLINRHRQRKFKADVEKFSHNQIRAMLTVKLTLIEKAKGLLSREAWENYMDEVLHFISDVRADAEYKMVFGIDSKDVSENICSLCSLAINRLIALAK